MALFCLWRFVLGVGIGGDYPLSAVITSEFASKHFRGTLIAAVFSMQARGRACGAAHRSGAAAAAALPLMSTPDDGAAAASSRRAWASWAPPSRA